ncbi:MAG: glutathione S-transferase [Hyphomonadaceae bacterium]|nr:glutathione S-transferase [Hyphomonadaceae bacterium]
MTELILANLNYSSWSIRAALVSRASGLSIPERVVPIGFPETKAQLIEETGLHTLPVLIHHDLIIRDSYAITEWIAEQTRPGAVWPEDPSKRALARSVCAEMHSGFIGLRSQMPVDIRSSLPTPKIEDDLKTNIERVLQLWENCRAQYASDGDFLFGDWSAADAFYAPVVTRFRTYGYALSGAARAYSEAVWNHPLLVELRAQAEAEPWEIEMGFLGPARAWVRE